jgi:very-short-patch-repair endonuclease
MATDAQKRLRAEARKELEEHLDGQLRRRNIHKRHPYGREVRFHPERQFRADFLWGRPAMLMVEVDGGTYSQGRHTRGEGFEKDRKKDHLAALLGYCPLHFTAKQVKSEYAADIIETYLEHYGRGGKAT